MKIGLTVLKYKFYIAAPLSLVAVVLLIFAFTKEDRKLFEEESSKLIAAVSELVTLPENEIPTIATVSDLEKLKDQPFFARAQLGDKVLIYTRAQKAILYRPVDGKIIEIAPLNINN